MPARDSAPRYTDSIKKDIATQHLSNSKQKWIDAVGISDWKPSKLALLCEVGTKACIQMFYNVTSININKNNSIL